MLGKPKDEIETMNNKQDDDTKSKTCDVRWFATIDSTFFTIDSVALSLLCLLSPLFLPFPLFEGSGKFLSNFAF